MKNSRRSLDGAKKVPSDDLIPHQEDVSDVGKLGTFDEIARSKAGLGKDRVKEDFQR